MTGTRVAGALRAAALCAFLASWPAVASACPYCAGSGDATGADVLSAIGMALMPIGFGVGLVLWLRRRMRTGAPGDSAAGAPPPAGDASRR